eukprot:m.1635172 g.1635172  ORF g.1635172 m.1635172 type:complete len:926 (+) comp25420_c1_seq1:276-3053(+)
MAVHIEDLYAKTFHPQDEFDDTRTTDTFDDVVGSASWKQAPPEVEWHHGKISREDASSILIEHGPGSFLVRESVSRLDGFSISFRVEAGVKHFKIIRHEYGDYFIADNSFSSLAQVVEHYYNEPLSDNLNLKHPIAPADGSGIETVTAVVSLVDISGRGENELSCSQGERLAVLNAENPDWLFVSKAGGKITGFVPRPCVKDIETRTTTIEAEVLAKLPSTFHRSRWIHGKMDRMEAESLLNDRGSVGSFLVRQSADAGSYSLSFRGPKKLQHFRIRCRGLHDYECGGRTFPCLEAVVLRYYTEPIMDGMTLLHPMVSNVVPDERYDVDGELYSEVQPVLAAVEGAKMQAPKPLGIFQKVESLRVRGGKAATDKSGYIVKKAKRSKKWKRFFFVLLVDKKRLEYFEDKDAFKPKGIIDLESCSVFSLHETFFGRPNCFQIAVQSADIYLCCNTEADTNEWMDALAPHCGTVGFGPLVRNADKRSTVMGLNLSIMEAKNFTAKSSTLYCIVSLNYAKMARTPAVQVKGDSVFWGEEFVFDNLSDVVHNATVILYSRGKLKDKKVAEVVLQLSTLKPNTPLDKWCDMMSEGSAVGSGGSMRLKAVYSSDVLLPLKKYAKLNSQLSDPALSYALVLADALKGRVPELARNLVRIWVAGGIFRSLVHVLVSKDVAQEASCGTLFRGNSLGTKCIDQYMKETGLPFLHQAIGEPIRQLFEEKRSCELDPTRKGGKTENMTVLLTHVDSVLRGIDRAVTQCPAGLRAVLASVRELASQRWPDNSVVQYTSVSAFIFLRFFCPAVLNPKLFNMMPDHPSETTARNLTLVAKVVQNMANMTEFGEKEAFMIICNDYIKENRGDMQRILSALSIDSDGGPAERADASTGAQAQRALAAVFRMAHDRKDALKKTGTTTAKNILSSLDAINKLTKK